MAGALGDPVIGCRAVGIRGWVAAGLENRVWPWDGKVRAPLPGSAVPRLLRSAVRSLGPPQRDADEMTREQGKAVQQERGEAGDRFLVGRVSAPRLVPAALLFLFAMHDHDRSGQLDGLELLQLLGAVLTQGGAGRPSSEAVCAGVRAPRGPCSDLCSHCVPIHSRPRRWPRWWTELWSSGTAAGTDCWTLPSCCCPPRHVDPREEAALHSRGGQRGTLGSRRGSPRWGRRRWGRTWGRAAPKRDRFCRGMATSRQRSRESPRSEPPWKRTRRRNRRRPSRTESPGSSPPRRRHPPPWGIPGRCRREKGMRAVPCLTAVRSLGAIGAEGLPTRFPRRSGLGGEGRGQSGQAGSRCNAGPRNTAAAAHSVNRAGGARGGCGRMRWRGFASFIGRGAGGTARLRRCRRSRGSRTSSPRCGSRR